MSDVWIRVEEVNGARAVNAIATLLSISVADARALLEDTPLRLPATWSAGDADAIVEDLERRGVSAHIEPVTHSPGKPCREHSNLVNDGTCDECGAWICAVCRARADGRRLCGDCLETRRRKRRFKRWRIAVLMLVLVSVGAWALNVQLRRDARTQWERTLSVAIILVAVEPLDEQAVAGLRRRVPVLEELLHAQARRYDPGIVEPIDFRIVGPVDGAPPPKLPYSATWWQRLEHAWTLERTLSSVDERAGIDASGFDARVYLYARRPTEDNPRYVEGLAEKGGEVATVEVDLDEDTVDLTLIAAAHEFFHLLGAVDQYRPDGQVIVPSGLADPDRVPRFPQDRAALMARSIPKSRTEFEIADELSEIVVGFPTAEAVGWARDDR